MFAWNKANEEKLAALWAEGLSASAVARQIGCKSRSAVIGKVHRLKLPGRKTAFRTAEIKRIHGKRRKSNLPKVRDMSLEPPVRRVPGLQYINIVTTEPAIDAPSATPKSVETLTSRCCRWPIGDPQDAAFHFCGGSSVPGLPYCQGHAARAYQAPLARTRPSYVKGRASVFDKGTNARVYA
jgi:GcrA cell cycle regulator